MKRVGWLIGQALSRGSLALDCVWVLLLFSYSFGPLAHFECGSTWPVRESAMLELPACTRDCANLQASCASVSFVNDLVFSRNCFISSICEGLLCATYLKIISIS